MESGVIGIIVTVTALYLGIVLLTAIIIPRIKLKKLSLYCKQDLNLYLNKLDSYYKWTVDKVWLNCTRIMKLDALYKLKKYKELTDTLLSLRLQRIPSPYLLKFLLFTIDLSVLEEYELNRLCMEKLSRLHVENKNVSRLLTLVNNINQFLLTDYKQYNLLLNMIEPLSKMESDQYLSYLYYFAGIGYLHNGDSVRGSEFLMKSASCKTETSASIKSSELLIRG